MKKTLSKLQAKEQIEFFFKDIKDKSPKEIKKIKRFAMAYNIPLREKRKLFCKKCFSPRLKVKSVKKGIKTFICIDCDYVARYKIK